MLKLELLNVCKIYDGDVIGISDVNIQCKEEDFLVLVGPSGCGKSTTLRLIAGLERITSGEIYISGKLVNNLTPKERDISMVFQDYALYPHMTVYQNMAFGLKMRKYSKDDIAQKVANASRILQLDKLLDRYPRALSGGQRQRVALGRAIVRDPQLFLFDEPLSNLDAKLREEMRAEILRLHAKLNATIVYVTHDQIEAMTMGTLIVVLDKGIIQQIADPLTLYNRPVNKFVAGFIGSPTMNFIEGELMEGKFVSPYFSLPDIRDDNSINKGLKSLALSVTMGVRPEDIIIHKKEGVTSGEVEIVETLGSELYVYVLLNNDKRLVIKSPANNLVKRGDKVYLKFDRNKLHFFDKLTEQRI